MSRRVKTVVLYGDINLDSTYWKEWIEYAKSIIYKHTNNNVYISVQGDGFNNTKIQDFDDKFEKKIISALEKEKNIDSIELYSLPDNFKQAAFDYEIYISRANSKRLSYVQVTILDEVYKELGFNYETIKKSLKEFINVDKTIVFEMDAKEFPPKFIMSKGRSSNFKTLTIIESN